MVYGVKAVPLEQCVPIERATQGQVTRRDLRPLDWQAIWPELLAPVITVDTLVALPTRADTGISALPDRRNNQKV